MDDQGTLQDIKQQYRRSNYSIVEEDNGRIEKEIS
jgi:hypothetical protein